MDTTPKYIRMSDCPEIQKGKKKPFFLSNKEKIVIDKKGQFWVTETIIDDHDPYGPPVKIIVAKAWLPLQHQIQAMLKGEKHSTFHLLETFYNFVKALIDQSSLLYADISMEQLWLLFYMHEKHGKVWSDSEGWVKA